MSMSAAERALEEERLIKATNDRRFAQLGQAMQLLFKTDRRKYSIASAYLWLWPAVRLNQIVCTTGRSGVWTGYATWAYFTPEFATTFVKSDPPFLHISDWNEGYQLWILDFVAPLGHARALVSQLRSRLSRDFKEARHVVRSPDGNVIGTRILRVPTSTLSHG
ncbi:toxin-activating lysine-acyltransferase [Dyella nitratireducens]|nr:toxin-activating lysine-acyltransferase [Dyella nitratireducens]